MLRFPGFIDICTEIGKGCWKAVTRQAVRSGYTALLAAPMSTEVCSEKRDAARMMAEPEADSFCDYAKIALITPENIRTIDEWAAEVPAALADFSVIESAGSFAQMNLLSRLFNRWPAEKPICVRGTENQIGSAIFMAQVHGRKVHVCSVTTRAEIEMVDEAKRSGLPVTCDTHPLNLLFGRDAQNGSGFPVRLGTEDDRQALWKYFGDIDCFSSAGYSHPGGEAGEALGIMLPLLFSMKKSQMLTDEDILRRCCVNPARIFGIRPDPSTVVEAEDPAGSRPYIRTVTLRGSLIYSADAPDADRPGGASAIKGYSV